MSTSPDTVLIQLIAELLGQLKKRQDAGELVDAYGRGELTTTEIVQKLAAQYQSGIGGAVRGLAELNKDAAVQLGELLRNRLDVCLAELETGPGRAGKPAPRKREAVSFKDRDDAVLLREFALVAALTRSDEEVRSAQLFEIAAAVAAAANDKITNEAVTAQLGRLVDQDVVGKVRKGRYHGTAQSKAHLASLKAEIEARGLALPAV